MWASNHNKSKIACQRSDLFYYFDTFIDNYNMGKWDYEMMQMWLRFILCFHGLQAVRPFLKFLKSLGAFMKWKVMYNEPHT